MTALPIHRPTFVVQVMQTQESFACAPGESLLLGMLRLGRKGIPVGCINGGCGVCRVRVLEGQVQRLGPISRAHVSVEDEASQCTLACRVTPLSDVRLELAGKFERCFTKGFAAAASLIPRNDS